MIPDPQNPQAWNRYAYVNNSPVDYNDPTGHKPVEDSFCDGSRNQPRECQQLRLGGGGTTSGGNIPLTGTPPVVNSPGTTSSGGGSSPCQEDDDMCWLQQGKGDNSRPTIPTDPTQHPQPLPSAGSESSSTQQNGPNWEAFILGGLLIIGGGITMGIGELAMGSALGEIAGTTLLAPETLGLSEVFGLIHAPAVFAVGGIIWIVGVYGVSKGAEFIYDSGVFTRK